MRLLSPILQRVVYPVLGKSGYFHAQASASVVTYHGVLPESYRSVDPFLDGALVSVPSFRSHLQLLKKHYNVITPDLFRRWLHQAEELPQRAVLLTCDDGLLNNLTTMLPTLQEEGLQCLFFVTGVSLCDAPELMWYVELYLMLMESQGDRQSIECQGIAIPAIPGNHIGKRACWPELMKILSRVNAVRRIEFLHEAVGLWGLERDWKRKYLDDPILRQRFQLLRAPKVKELAGAGMTIGAHTMSHPVLAEQPAELAQPEIADCREILQRCSGQTVWAMAYPFGDSASVGKREYGFAEAAGYECAFLNVGGPVNAGLPKFSLPRIHVTGDMSLPVYEANVSGFHHTLQATFRGRRLERNSER